MNFYRELFVALPAFNGGYRTYNCTDGWQGLKIWRYNFLKLPLLLSCFIYVKDDSYEQLVAYILLTSHYVNIDNPVV